jgi:alpha-beta hydrolase superfamily lysophospholipase
MTRGQLSYMAREFRERGFAVVAYDKRGVGGSTGE